MTELMTRLAPLKVLQSLETISSRTSAERDVYGKLVPNLRNTMQVLRSEPLVCDSFAFDEMLSATILQRALPERGSDSVGDGSGLPRPIRDTDVSQLQEWLQGSGLLKVSRDIVHQSVLYRAKERGFHPVRDYLEALQWDGDLRVEKWLSSYLGVEDTAYATEVGTMFLVAMVARVFQPGCKADYMLTLEGDQGARKSTACQILGGEWFTDNLPDVTTGGKDVSLHLNGKWLIEVAEMSALSKAESAHLKAFVSRSTERYRPPYGREEIIQPRQCVFIGSTNKSAYLRDETGGRRFWPVKVGQIDTDALSCDRDQIFAEAVDMYRSGRAWWPDAKFEQRYIRLEQEARYENDVWEETIEAFVRTRTSVSVIEIARDCLFIDNQRVGTAEQRRISACLERLRWKREKKDWKGRILWVPG